MPKPKGQEGSSDPNIQILSEVHAKLQAIGALRSYHHAHPESDVDEFHPENNSPEIRKEAMQEWIGGGDAVAFGDYRDGHPDDEINLGDPVGLGEFLDKILRKDNDTMH